MRHVILSFLPNVVSTNLDEKASRLNRVTLSSRRHSTLRRLADKDRRRYWRRRALGVPSRVRSLKRIPRDVRQTFKTDTNAQNMGLEIPLIRAIMPQLTLTCLLFGNMLRRIPTLPSLAG